MATRRPLGAGGLTKKTGTYRSADGERVPYSYWEASREVPADKLPRGLTRKRVTGSGPTRTDALARLEKNWEAFERGEANRGATRLTGKMTVRRLYEEWDRAFVAIESSPTQRRAYAGIYNNHILPAMGDRRLDALTGTELAIFFNQTLPDKRKTQLVNGQEVEAGPLLGGAARRNIYMALSSALSFAVREGYLARSPLIAVKAPPRDKPDEDIKAFLRDAARVREHIQSGDHPDETRWLLTLLGLRQSERLGLTWGMIRDLDTDAPSLKVAYQLKRIKGEGLILDKPKGDKTRTIQLVEPWVTSLRNYRKKWLDMHEGEEWTDPPEHLSDLLFLTPKGRPIAHKTDTDDWHDLLAESGVSYWRQHLMRHYTAMMLAELPDMSLNDVMSILGHEGAAISAYYAHMNEGRRTAAITNYGRMVQQH